MKLPKILPLLAAIFVFSTIAACASRSDNAVNTGADSNGSTPQASATENNQSTQTIETTQSQRHSTKTDTISVEGEKTEVTLKRYDQASHVFTTYFPENDFVAESSGSGEGTGTRFYFNAGGQQNKDVYVALFFPAQATSLEQIKQLVTQEPGLLESNQWKVVNQTEEVPYAWAKERIVFEEQRPSSQNIQGEVYIGESNGKAFYVITHYPAEYAEGFGPRADLLLKNLQLPINR